MTSQGPKFQVDAKIFETFPDYIVGCVQAHNLPNHLANEKLDDLINHAEQRVRTIYEDVDLKEVPQIGVWRNAISAAGWSASKFPASVEAVIKRVVRGQNLPRINPVVDLANATVLTYAVPVGTHDVASFGGEILTVRPCMKDDQFRPIGSDVTEQPDVGEIIYACGANVRTRRWVWRQSQDALVSSDATSIFFPVDGFSRATGPQVEAATAFIAAFCRDEFGATVSTGLVTSESRHFA